MTARSYLFVPATRPDRYERALASGADAVIVDLEDAVAAPDKAAARDALRAWLAGRAPAAPGVIVRVNAAGTRWHDDDLALCMRPGVAGVLVPKAESADALHALAAQRSGLQVIALIESARGLANARAIGNTSGVTRLAFGSIDLALDLGLRGASEDDLAPHRAELVLASRLSGLPAPIDGVTASIDDVALLRNDVQRARRLGFGAKLCIHPKQLASVHEGLAPSEAEQAWARRIVAAAGAAGGAAVAVDGAMVDRPVLQRAQSILDEAQRGAASAAQRP
jgi:citrate lyase subunit beta / citryl-CoA lyase